MTVTYTLKETLSSPNSPVVSVVSQQQKGNENILCSPSLFRALGPRPVSPTQLFPLFLLHPCPLPRAPGSQNPVQYPESICLWFSCECVRTEVKSCCHWTDIVSDHHTPLFLFASDKRGPRTPSILPPNHRAGPVFSYLIAHVALSQAPHVLWLRTGSHPPLAFCKTYHLSADFLTTPPTTGGFHMPPVVLELTMELRVTLNFWSCSLHLPSARITVTGRHTLPK